MSLETKMDPLMELTVDVVSSYVANNEVSLMELEETLDVVYAKLQVMAASRKHISERKPSVAIEDSVHPDYLVCLEDGKRLKMLKRYLKSNYDMTPQEYRERWGLPADYPMVAPNYSKKRSKLAKQIGLGSQTQQKSSAGKGGRKSRSGTSKAA